MGRPLTSANFLDSCIHKECTFHALPTRKSPIKRYYGTFARFRKRSEISIRAGTRTNAGHGHQFSPD